jgi:poly(3-hydroxyalkanoate) synthetase
VLFIASTFIILNVLEIEFLLFSRRYGDKSNTDLELEDFLVKAYKKQIKELNSATGRKQQVTK